jgi:hypothetical protein
MRDEKEREKEEALFFYERQMTLRRMSRQRSHRSSSLYPHPDDEGQRFAPSSLLMWGMSEPELPLPQLMLLGVYASGTHFDFMGTPIDAMRRLLGTPHVTRSLITLHVGRSFVFGCAHTPHIHCLTYDERAHMVSRFATAVLLLRRVMRHNRRRLTAVTRHAVLGGCVARFLAEQPSTEEEEGERLRATRALMHFSGFSLYDLLMRCDASLLFRPEDVPPPPFTLEALEAEQSAWLWRASEEQAAALSWERRRDVDDDASFMDDAGVDGDLFTKTENQTAAVVDLFGCLNEAHLPGQMALYDAVVVAASRPLASSTAGVPG